MLLSWSCHQSGIIIKSDNHVTSHGSHFGNPIFSYPVHVVHFLFGLLLAVCTYNNILLEIGEKAPFFKYKKDRSHLRMMEAKFFPEK